MSKINLISKLYDEFKNSGFFEEINKLDNSRQVEIFLSEKIHSGVLPKGFSQFNDRFHYRDYYLRLDTLNAPPIMEKDQIVNWVYEAITTKHLLTAQD
ncbi:hypothetical protein ACQUGU_06590 [Acinetobacter baumannii]|uniref:hypothetical protein n=1 Tax=Acinetobacter baumannii TaxID=470 RepID=UPI003FA39C86